MKIEMDDVFGRPKWWEPIWWSVQQFVENWVWPAYSLRNLLFNRYDIVRLANLKSTEYCDVVERMFQANMELISFFMEKEKPERYVCWYKDDFGNDVGHKYGECKDYGNCALYPEYDGKYIMDIIKEIYHWWKVEYPRLCKEREYLLSFWCEYVCGKMKSIPAKTEGYSQIVFDTSECPKTLDYFNNEQVKWEIIDKYLDGNRNNIFAENFVSNKLHELESEIERQKQKNLHLCIEVRPYLWT